ncbi:elongation of very long chain fatty acids protein AAEL008004 [Tetranychus urticae]|uniref:Elongation of very long chain fatty acids protein n=1 Tax=Tetranychus urticae TaxID=32264 RepID=T1JWI8_TETUR|nr:elongation of very long chain fatty acids protein AAEL008004 [Tetranychus urticae]
MSFSRIGPSTSPFVQYLGKSFNYYSHEFWNHQGDPRVSIYPFFTSGPWLTLTLVALYLVTVKYVGPLWMRDRKPYDLRRLLIVYNLLMVTLSSYLFYQGCILLSFGLDTWGCQPINSSDYSPETRHFLNTAWIFFASKLIEFMDTLFFVLRKKNSHISNLHVIHHSTVPLSVWIGFKFAPGGNNAFFPLLNSGVHMIMYTYYGLTAIVSGSNGSSNWPRVNQFLRSTKKYLTTLQMGQFILAIVHGLSTLAQPDCSFPKSSLAINLGNAIIFLILFYSFYRKAYIKKSN